MDAPDIIYKNIYRKVYEAISRIILFHGMNVGKLKELIGREKIKTFTGNSTRLKKFKCFYGQCQSF